MKRPSMYLTMLILAALLLAACGAEENGTSLPSTTVPPVTVDATGTSEPAATDPAGTDMTTTPAVPVTGEDSTSRLSNLLDYGVWNQEDEQIGDVSDMVLDMDNSVIQYVIVGTGGFLGLGENQVFVPLDMLELQSSTDDGTLPGSVENRFVFTGETDLYNNAPNIDINNTLPERGAAANDWDADIRSYWESGVVPDDQAGTETETPSADATAVPDTAATDDPNMTATADPNMGETGTTEATALQGVLLASEVIGSRIQVGAGQAMEPGMGEGMATADPNTTVDPNATADPNAAVDPNATATLGPDAGTVPGFGETMDATVEDVIVDPQTGDIQYLVISGGFADDQRWIPVPLNAVQWNNTNQNFWLGANTADLQDAPGFASDQFPDTSTTGWDQEFSNFWQNIDTSGGTTAP